MSEDVVKQMFAVGAHFGYSKSRNHPSSRPFIFGFKNRSAVIDLAQTREQLTKAKDFLGQLAAAGKPVLFVGNKDEARGIIRQAAEGVSMPYVASRWLGGTLTNFSQIKNRLQRMKELKEGRDSGGWSVYTKKERLMMEREIARLERYFATLVSLTALPAALVVVDSGEEVTAVAEAKILGIPVVGLANTDCDVKDVAYPIVANDGAAASIRFFVSELAAAYDRGHQEAVAAAQAAPTPSPVDAPVLV